MFGRMGFRALVLGFVFLLVNFNFPALVRADQVEVADAASVKQEIYNLLTLPEFQILKSEAEKRGVRLWLFGGSSHTVAMKARNKVLGKSQPFPDSLTNLYSWIQDIDIVLDGNEEDASYLEQLAATTLGQSQIARMVWEFRLLRGIYKNKEPLLTVENKFSKRHSDSASLGFIEITDPVGSEPRIRDLRDWSGKKCDFFDDVLAGTVRLYYSEEHDKSMGASMGQNPPVLEAQRIITKALQHGLSISPEDFSLIRKMIRSTDINSVLSREYPRRWLIRNAYKLFYATQNVAGTVALLEASGLDKVLRKLQTQLDSGHRYYDMAGEVIDLLDQFVKDSKFKLRREGLNQASIHLPLNNLKFHYLANDYIEFELNKFLPRDGQLISLKGLPITLRTDYRTFGAVAGALIPVKIDPAATEGVDYDVIKSRSKVPIEIRVTNPTIVSIDFSGTEIFSPGWTSFLNTLKENRNNRKNNLPRVDFRIVERMRTTLLESQVALTASESRLLNDLAQEEFAEERPDFSILRAWSEAPGSSARYSMVPMPLRTLKLYSSLMTSIGWDKNRAQDEDTLSFFDDAIATATDQSNVGESEVTTIVKDFLKSHSLAYLPKAKLHEYLKALLQPHLLDLFAERFIGRVDPNIIADDPNEARETFKEFIRLAVEVAENSNRSDFEAKVKSSLEQNGHWQAMQASETNDDASENRSEIDTLASNLGNNKTAQKKIDSFVPPKAKKLAKAPKLIRDALENLAQNRNKYAEILLAASETILNDVIAEAHYKDELNPIFGRREEAASVMDTLVRHKGKNPVLVGEAGVGKTSVMELVAQLIYFGEIPDAKQYQSDLNDAIVIQTSPGRISKLAKSNAPSAQAAAVEEYLDAVKAMQVQFNQKIILFVDEIHRVEAPQIEALKPYLDNSKGVMLVGASTDRELLMALDRNEAFARRIHRIPVREFTVEETKQLLTDTVVPLFEKKYSGQNSESEISEEAIDFIVKRSLEYNPDVRRPEGPFKLLQDAVIRAHRAAGKDSFKLTDEDVSNFLVEALDLPLNPRNLKTFSAGLVGLREKLLSTVIEQDRVVDAMLGLWSEIYFATEPKDSLKVLLVAGPTGAGKTFSAKEFAKEALGDERRMLEIDCTKFSSGGLSLNSLIGAPNGVISSDTSKGVLPEFLMGRGRGMNVIVLNEFDKAHPDLAKQIMEMIDTGKLQGGDGQTYFTGRSLVVITTNKGDDHIYPRDREEALTKEEIDERLSHISDDDIKQWFMETPKNDMYDTSMNLPPSFLQRIARAVPAAPVSMEGALEIAKRKYKKSVDSIYDAHRFSVELQKKALEHLVKATYVPENGVREVERAVEKMLSQVKTSLENDIEEGETVRVTLEENEKGAPQFRAAVVTADKSERRVAISEAPKGRRFVENPLFDEEVRKRLSNIETELASRVFGQDDAIRLSARAIRTREINLLNNRPTSLLFLGPTGIGKTELAKTIAQKIYGSDKRISIFDMGSVKWEGDFNNIFGSPKGFVGSGTPSPFEQFLMDFPEGGVVVFDEIGNMGGGSKKIKNDLLKRFYAMLEEGEWRSVHGKNYSLKKFVFVFTSNEGQEFFYNLPSDDLRLAAWKGVKDKDAIRKILMDHGWPEAFVGRLGEMVMFKPLMEKSRIDVAKKEIGRILDGQIKQYKLAGIHADDVFFAQVAETFFSHAEGGRSIRKFAEGPLTDLIGKVLIELLQKYPSLSGTGFTFDLTDNYKGLLSFDGAFPPNREVILSIKTTTNGEEVVMTSNLAKDAPKKRIVSVDELRLTAFHEAGHAVANDVEKTGSLVAFVTIVGQGEYGGYARHDDVGTGRSPTRERVVASLAGMFAGGIAEARARGNGEMAAGRSQDLKMASALAKRAITEWRLSSKAHSFPINDKGEVDVKSKIVQEEIKQLLDDGFVASEKVLDAEWTRVEKVAQALMEKQFLMRDDLDELLIGQKGIKAANQVGEEDETRAASSLIIGQERVRGCSDIFGN